MTPKCPNHLVPMQYSGTPRIYICPVSSARFECDDELSSAEQKRDKFGRLIKEFKITPLDGEDG